MPPAPEDIPATEEELEKALADDRPVESDENAPRSSRPGQKGFAERFMAKYGWTKGSGLGADGSGITKALQVKVEKQKKKPDSEGGGFATPAGRGKIIAETRKTEEGKFGAISEVIVLHGMLEGLDLDAEMESGNLVQEIGEECNEKVWVYKTAGTGFRLTVIASMVASNVYSYTESVMGLFLFLSDLLTSSLHCE